MSRRTLLAAATLLLAALLVLRLGWTWADRFTHPFDLEWMEGGMLVDAWRLQEGLSLYPAPGRDFVPTLYPPGYPTVLAFLGNIFPLGHALGRGVSLLGTLAAALASQRVVRVHGGSGAAGWIAAAMFLGCYPFSGAFYDLVRLDGLSMGLLSWALVLGARQRRGALLASALLLTAAFLVKQHAALFGLPIVVGLWLRDGRRSALRFALVAAVPAVLVTAWLQWRTGGLYLTYLLEVPASHGMVGRRIFPGTPTDLARALPVASLIASGWLLASIRLSSRPTRGLAMAAATILGAVAVTATWAMTGPFAWMGLFCLSAVVIGTAGGLWTWRREPPSWRWAYGVGVAITTLVVVALMRGHVGGFVNVLMPAHWMIATAFGLWLARTPHALAYGATALQLIWLFWAIEPRFDPRADVFADWSQPDRLVPTAADRAAGEEVVKILAKQPGPVLSPFAPWLAVQAGHRGNSHLIALWDIDHRGGPLRYGILDIEAAIKEGYWATVVEGTRSLKYGVREHYRTAEQLDTRRALSPKTGWRAKPSRIMVPTRARPRSPKGIPTGPAH